MLIGKSFIKIWKMVYEKFSKNACLTPIPFALFFTQHYKIFFKTFSKIQPNMKKKSFLLKSFSSENIQQTKPKRINETIRKSPVQVGYWALPASA